MLASLQHAIDLPWKGYKKKIRISTDRVVLLVIRESWRPPVVNYRTKKFESIHGNLVIPEKDRIGHKV